MRKYHLNKLVIILLLLMISFMISCNSILNTQLNESSKTNEDITIEINENKSEVLVGQIASLNKIINGKLVTWESNDEDIFHITNYFGRGIKVGNTLINAIDTNDLVVATYLISVIEEKPESITITGNQNLDIGQVATYRAIVYPTTANQEVTWKISDDSVASIIGVALDYSVNIEAKKAGLTVLSATTVDGSIVQEINILVIDNDKEIIINNKFISDTEIINTSSLENLLSPLINVATSYTLKITGSIINQKGDLTESTNGSCLVYKRNVIDSNGNEVLENETNDVIKYVYYAITNRHIVKDCDVITVNDNNLEINASLIQYDSKVNLAVIKFETNKYIPYAKFADSEEIQTGEFCIAVGNPFDYSNTATFGIISYPNRYVSDDVDGDGTIDWDAQYIQYDAAINDGNSGGPLINMKGEVIGINTTKISEAKVENMSFAIPSNLVLELIEFLEKGIQPERPLLGVTVLSVKNILVSETLMTTYIIPEEITFGMYVESVTSSGVGYIAGIQKGDIILQMRGEDIKYSYELRAQLGKSIIGSGEKIEIVVYRNGERISLYVVF